MACRLGERCIGPLHVLVFRLHSKPSLIQHTDASATYILQLFCYTEIKHLYQVNRNAQIFFFIKSTKFTQARAHSVATEGDIVPRCTRNNFQVSVSAGQFTPRKCLETGHTISRLVSFFFAFAHSVCIGLRKDYLIVSPSYFVLSLFFVLVFPSRTKSLLLRP